MSKSNTFENDLLELMLNNVGVPLVGDATGILPSATNGSLYVSLHTADPGEAGNQSTSEATYTGYARIAVARNPGSKKWTVVNGSASNAEILQGTACTAGANAITHVTVGTSAAGAGKVLYRGALSASLAISNGITPEFAIGAITISED